MNKPPELRARLLIVPGLNNSGPTHWQSWLQARHPGAVRVEQRDWREPAIDAWAERVEATLKTAGPGPWLAVAHSFGCLALARYLQASGTVGLRAGLLVAPADPERFGLQDSLPGGPLPLRSTWVASTNDPWMAFGRSRDWSQRWGCRWLNLGAVGHINVAGRLRAAAAGCPLGGGRNPAAGKRAPRRACGLQRMGIRSLTRRMMPCLTACSSRS